MKSWISPGLVLLDEPESALSPQRQLALLALMYDHAQRRNAQFIVATHSPLLLTFPGATILGFDGESEKPASSSGPMVHVADVGGTPDVPDVEDVTEEPARSPSSSASASCRPSAGRA